MSPIKPSLSALRPGGPQPSRLRQINCPQCGGRFEATRKAMSLTCPHCTTHLVFKDVSVDRPIEGRIDTLGDVEIAPTSSLTGDVACGHLVNDGQFEGSAKVHGPIELTGKSETSGELTGISLEVQRGATLQGRARIGRGAAKDRNQDSDDQPPLAAPIKRPKIRVRRAD